jgi:hypothetical protein
MKKLIATLFALIILIIVGYLFYGGFSTSVSTDNYKTITILGEKRIVFKVDVNPAWSFSTHLNSEPRGIERWKKVIMLDQTDYMKFLSPKESEDLYGRVSLNPEQIESQRKYVINRFKESRFSLSVMKLYVVLDTKAKTCRMIVPIHGPQGVYYISSEWINSDWYMVPAVGAIDWETANAKEIIRAIESEPLSDVEAEDFDRVMRRFSSTYLD